jgi:ABC-2 type transport system ATP-binding protein
VGLAQALVHEPALIVLDEPASGLDPVQAVNLRELVRSLGRSHPIVLSTHVLADVPACCDRVAIIHQGRLRHAGPALEEADGRTLRVQTAKPASAADWATSQTVASATALAAGAWRVRLREGATVPALAAEIVARFGLVALATERAPLEQVFLAIAAGEPLAPAA